MQLRQLGRTGLTVTEVCVGTSPLGGMPAAYGYDVDATTARQAVREVFDSEVNFLDTSNEYSAGESEKRIGDVIRERGGLPGGFVLATKADPAQGAASFPAERARESFVESTQRLGVSHVPLFYLHDPYRFSFEEMNRSGGVVDQMVALKSEGLVGHLGVADGDTELLMRFIDTGHFDVVLNHNRYTLVDQSAEKLMNHAADAGIAFVNAAPYGGGILAKGAEQQPLYAYSEAGSEVRAHIVTIQQVCAEWSVDLAAAALQFSTRDPRVASTVVGLSKPGRIAALVENAKKTLPKEFWNELDSMIGPGAR